MFVRDLAQETLEYYIQRVRAQEHLILFHPALHFLVRQMLAQRRSSPESKLSGQLRPEADGRCKTIGRSNHSLSKARVILVSIIHPLLALGAARARLLGLKSAF